MDFLSRHAQVWQLGLGLALGAALTGPALAALGQAPAVLPSGAVQRSLQAGPAASASASASASYTLIESIDTSGVTVHEYVSPAGIVFAVTWSGPARPDLSVLLGARPYAQMVAAGSLRRGPVEVDQSDLVIHSGGRMGALRGSAWIPSLVPAGVSVEQLP
ncbi:DUF2844 domain-containing protein [Variovorax ginsengisoli]|uniref:DUF2844 domain-containing protein n=1 Tax=Variovorax ginsengisoli TaxID=363844 RepID=A0ABT9S0P0_9BURK|nr:DUF2844 domain-containing protein [Variovorax ginsengisoli]MDP9897770.1 hypothetical protein [Variovorax ginsengisoli]